MTRTHQDIWFDADAEIFTLFVGKAIELVPKRIVFAIDVPVEGNQITLVFAPGSDKTLNSTKRTVAPLTGVPLICSKSAVPPVAM